jgi:putative transcriptional regulator
VSGRDPRGALEPDLLDADALAGEEVAPSERLRSAVLGSIASASRLAGFGDRLATFFDLAPARAGELLREAAGEAAGWETLTPGARLFHLAGGPRVVGADCGLVRIEPGVRFPQHRHLGDEWSLILAGEAEEEGSGARWAPGDLVLRSAESVHAFRAVGSEPLVFAVVLQGGLEFDAV